jgi:Leucine-rich repeat (LRR) protein
MNRLRDIKEICRQDYGKLEVLDVGNNQISEIPVAVVYFLGALNTFCASNNNLTSLPPWIGFHRTLANLTIDGNPMKQIRA